MIRQTTLTLGVILPNTKIFGGVKRFFEIGNILISGGHRFMVFTPDGSAPAWFPFEGEVLKLAQISSYSFDAVFITEPQFLKALEEAKTRLRIFYAVLQRHYVKKAAARKELIVFANSRSLFEYLGGTSKPNLVQCIGGIDTKKFAFRPLRSRSANEPFVVLAYGRFYRKKKGTSMVIKSCESLYRSGYNIKLLLFDSPVDDKARKKVEDFSCKLPHEFFVDYPVERLAELYYKADVFVSAERNAGWSNTCAEAMACGVSVIATRSGTEDFLIHEQTGLRVWRHPWFIKRAIRRLCHDDTLRQTLAVNARKQIEMFSWDRLATTIEEYILARLA